MILAILDSILFGQRPFLFSAGGVAGLPFWVIQSQVSPNWDNGKAVGIRRLGFFGIIRHE